MCVCMYTVPPQRVIIVCLLFAQPYVLLSVILRMTAEEGLYSFELLAHAGDGATHASDGVILAMSHGASAWFGKSAALKKYLGEGG